MALNQHRRAGAALVSVLVFSGCAAAPRLVDGPTRVWIGLSATALEPAPDLAPGVDRLLEQAIETNEGAVDVVVATKHGTRSLLHGDLVLRRGSEIERSADRRAILSAARIAEIRTAVSSAAGSSGVLDTAGLLEEASRLGGNVTAVVVSSGLQSVGPLSVSAIGWDRLGSAEVVDEAARRGLVPNLAGASVVFSGLGDTAGEQAPLPGVLRDRLVAFWLAVCRRGGAVDCSVDTEPLPAVAAHSTVPVTPIAVPDEPPLVLPTVAHPAPRMVELPSDVLFAPDDATLLPAAVGELAHYAEMIARAGVRVALVGHTASVPPADGARALSLRRAEAVRDALVAGGVSPNLISASGVGFDDPLVVDRGPDGSLVPDAAQRNRAVVATLTLIGDGS